MTTFAPIDALPAEVLEAYRAQLEELQKSLDWTQDNVRAEYQKARDALEKGLGVVLASTRQAYSSQAESIDDDFYAKLRENEQEYNRQCAELLGRLLSEHIARQVA